MLLLLLNYVVFRALWKIDVYPISTLVNKKCIIIISPNNFFMNYMFVFISMDNLWLI